MLPLSDGLQPRRFPIVNVALVGAAVTSSLVNAGRVIPQSALQQSAFVRFGA